MHGRARDALLANNWWAAAVRGISAIIIGSIALFMPVVALLTLVMIFAAYCLVDGIFSIVLAVRGARKHQRWGWLVFNGIVSIAAGTMAVFYPVITSLVLAIMFAAWALISGAATIAAGAALASGHGRWWLIAGGAIAVLFGLFVIFSPLLGMLALSYVIGFQAWLAGLTLLALAFQLRARSIEAAGSGDIADSADAATNRHRPEVEHG
jgi:uncharacterized membrane protein HdeD (DUF308 family)